MQHVGMQAFEDAMFVRLFRLWVMSREEDRHPIPTMHAEAMKRGYKDQAAAACASLFELVEGHLGRHLVRECCCNPDFSSDEQALVGILHAAPSLKPGRGTREVPHGLPGAISWAASCVRDAMRMKSDPDIEAIRRAASRGDGCAFISPRGGGPIHGV